MEDDDDYISWESAILDVSKILRNMVNENVDKWVSIYIIITN
jgi:hypothetical protein